MRVPREWIAAGGTVMAFSVFSACEDPGAEEKRTKTSFVSQSPGLSYPVRWTLTDVAGRKLEADIIGREPTAITFRRVSDGRRFDFPLNRLSSEDRERVALLPLHHPRSKESNTDPGVLRLRRASLDELRDKIYEAERLHYGTDSVIKRRSLLSELGRLREEEAELVREIVELEQR